MNTRKADKEHPQSGQTAMSYRALNDRHLFLRDESYENKFFHANTVKNTEKRHVKRTENTS